MNLQVDDREALFHAMLNLPYRAGAGYLALLTEVGSVFHTLLTNIETYLSDQSPHRVVMADLPYDELVTLPAECMCPRVEVDELIVQQIDTQT